MGISYRRSNWEELNNRAQAIVKNARNINGGMTEAILANLRENESLRPGALFE
jgi:hypothetical protein